ncbi:MAG: cob(I)yrinic acid a,c-diamide adenosyltransferase [Bryobacteraceae bacterium]|jgi:cob(I)alamin adenosyltransferase
MAEKPYKEPALALNRIYTRTGDAGETALASGERVPKDARRIECYGTVDELNAWIGVARETASELAAQAPELAELSASLLRIQHELFNLGSVLATLPEKLGPRQPRIAEAEVAALEAEIDRATAQLAPLRSFVLPGGSRLNAELHVCRTVCRRAERTAVTLAREGGVDELCVRYLNRLSDALFVYSRCANQLLGVPETLWEPNRAASAL